jgi:AbrB family looped-hinge helix DNA binding protein
MQTNMTIKGQVTIPSAIRKAAGLVPGQPVEVVINDRGEAVVRAVDADAEREKRIQDKLARIREVQAKFRAQDTMPGMSTDEYMRLIRDEPFPR